MKKAIIYARQSSGDNEQSESVERQKENCRTLAKKENLEIIGEFADLNTSGKTYPAGAESIASLDSAFKAWFKQQTGTKQFRPGLGEVLTLIEKADYIIVDDITRLYRPVRGSYLENFINNKLTANGVKILQCKGGKIDLSQFDENLVNTIRAMINDEQIANGKMKSKQQLKARRDSGLYANGGGKAFGTEYIRANGTIRIKENFIPAIQYIFSSIAEYKPTMQILRGLNDRFSNLVAKSFYQSNVYNIAKNPVYCGYMFNSEGLLIENKQIENPCIDFALYSKVQEIMQGKKTGHRKEKFRWLPLSGLLHCGYCGSRLLANTEKRTKSEMITYSCNQAVNLGKKECSPSRINYSLKKDNYTGIFEAVKPLLVIALFDMLDKQEQAKQNGKKQDELKVQIANLQARKEKLTALFVQGLLNADELEKNLQAIKNEINACNSELLNIATSNPDDTTKHFNSLYKRFKADSFLNDELPHADYESLLQGTIKRIDCYADRVTVTTIQGQVTIPRLIYKNKRNMPVADMIINGKEDLTGIIIYKTGKKAVLADFGRVKVITR